MTLLAGQKKTLLRGKGNPPGWPQNWEFPGSNPPGWPRPIADGLVEFHVDRDVKLEIYCQDSFDEDTDALVGHYFEVEAFDQNGNRVRLRDSEDVPWAMRALIQIGPTENAHFGFSRFLQFDLVRAVGRVRGRVRVFGDSSTAMTDFEVRK
jgi:hypothetical protein